MRDDLDDVVVGDLVDEPVAAQQEAVAAYDRHVQASTRTDGSMPRALVTMLRRGWLRASSSVMWPVATSSCT